jgi:hypothetical protein
MINQQANTNQLTKTAYFASQPLSAIGTDMNHKNDNSTEDRDTCKSLPMAALGTKGNALSAIVTDKAANEAEGARTLNLRIDSPML